MTHHHINFPIIRKLVHVQKYTKLVHVEYSKKALKRIEDSISIQAREVKTSGTKEVSNSVQLES